ncbi:hypothetical protein IJT10_06890 [bacterium]|nr:hypothetical protein [bacterium]
MKNISKVLSILLFSLAFFGIMGVFAPEVQAQHYHDGAIKVYNYTEHSLFVDVQGGPSARVERGDYGVFHVRPNGNYNVKVRNKEGGGAFKMSYLTPRHSYDTLIFREKDMIYTGTRHHRPEDRPHDYHHHY